MPRPQTSVGRAEALKLITLQEEVEMEVVQAVSEAKTFE
jgi:hypothetical protein